MKIKWRKEEGAVIVVAVFVVLALVVIGGLASMLTNIELDISRNDRLGKEAFFVADAGCPISTKVIRDLILSLDEFDTLLTYDEDYVRLLSLLDEYDPNLLNEVMNYADSTEYPNDKDSETAVDPDIKTTVLGRDLTIDIDWRYKRSGPGGSLLFAMGYEGIGADRRHGGAKIYYDIHTKGEVSKNTTAEIDAVYLYQ